MEKIESEKINEALINEYETDILREVCNARVDEEEREVDEMLTSTIMDCCENILLGDSEDTWNLMEKYGTELSSRVPFNRINRAIQAHCKRLQHIEEMMEKLYTHQHTENGTVVVNIKD